MLSRCETSSSITASRRFAPLSALTASDAKFLATRWRALFMGLFRSLQCSFRGDSNQASAPVFRRPAEPRNGAEHAFARRTVPADRSGGHECQTGVPRFPSPAPSLKSNEARRSTTAPAGPGVGRLAWSGRGHQPSAGDIRCSQRIGSMHRLPERLGDAPPRADRPRPTVADVACGPSQKASRLIGHCSFVRAAGAGWPRRPPTKKSRTPRWRALGVSRSSCRASCPITVGCVRRRRR